MIRFMDAEVFCIDLSGYDRNEMFYYFLSRKNDKDNNGIEIILIYNGAEYYGLATYEKKTWRRWDIDRKVCDRTGRNSFCEFASDI